MLWTALDTVTEEGSCGVFQTQGETWISRSFKQWSNRSSNRSFNRSKAPLQGQDAKTKMEGHAEKLAGENVETPAARDISKLQGMDKKHKAEGSHSGMLPQVFKEALLDAKIQAQEADFFAVDIGPGRWTGVRFGVNLTKTLAFLFKKPVLPLNSLEVTAEKFFSSPEPVSAAFNAFKNSVYYGKFHKGKTLVPPCALPLKEWERIFRKNKEDLWTGDIDCFYKIPKSIRFIPARPDAKAMAQVIFRTQKKLRLLSWKQLSPLYLRSPL